MKFYIKQHKYYCGIDLHARSMYICISDQFGNILVHRNIGTDAEYFLRIIKPYKEDIVVAVECIFSWYWLADLCARHNITFVLGHALYMKAIHGGKAKNDKIDSAKINAILRAGTLPRAYVYPEKMRAARDLLRRRTHLVRKRSELMAHVINTYSQYNLPEIAKRLDRKCNHEGIAERLNDPSAQKNIEIDLAMIEHYNSIISPLEWHIKKTARSHDPMMYNLLITIPGVGPILTLVILYEIHDINRFPRVQDFISYSRLVKCAKESAGKRLGTSGSKIGNAHLKWAFSEAAVLFIRCSKERKRYYEKLKRRHGRGKSLSVLAAKLGRAVYYMLKKEKVFNEEKFLRHW